MNQFKRALNQWDLNAHFGVFLIVRFFSWLITYERPKKRWTIAVWVGELSTPTGWTTLWKGGDGISSATVDFFIFYLTFHL